MLCHFRQRFRKASGNTDRALLALLRHDFDGDLFENLDLKDLGERGPGEFLFSWAPLKLVGAPGSPGNPIAAWGDARRADGAPQPRAGSIADRVRNPAHRKRGAAPVPDFVL